MPPKIKRDGRSQRSKKVPKQLDLTQDKDELKEVSKDEFNQTAQIEEAKEDLEPTKSAVKSVKLTSKRTKQNPKKKQSAVQTKEEPGLQIDKSNGSQVKTQEQIGK